MLNIYTATLAELEAEYERQIASGDADGAEETLLEILAYDDRANVQRERAAWQGLQR